MHFPRLRFTLVPLILLILGSAFWSSGYLSSAPVSAHSAVNINVYLPVISNNFQAGPAIISGVVYDATIGKESGALAGAQVCIQNTTNCETSEADGSYSLGGINNGLHTVVATLNGYSTLVRQVTATTYNGTPQSITTLDLALSANNLSGNQYRIVLTWGGPDIQAMDLDGNLWLPAATPYYINQVSGTNAGKGNCSAFPDACIDIDSQDGSKPETISISQVHSGTYIYAVQHYDIASGNHNKPPLSQSNAHVDVYDANGLMASFDVPPSSDNAAVFWHVFNLDAVNGSLTPVNTISSTYPGPY